MDAFSVLLTIFIVSVLFVGALIAIAIFSALFRKKESRPTYSSTNQEPSSPTNQAASDIIEDSEGDGLMLFDDPMFPPEFNDEEEDDF
ncbi:MAG: hypothetical protein ABSG33_01930 [Candidatus Bathyarchaeia archaeon]